MWTIEPPTRNGYYLWRVKFENAPPAVEPFMVYTLPDGSQHVQELSDTREGTDRGNWLLSEWLFWCKGTVNWRPLEYMFLGGLDTEWSFVRAFRELYNAAESAHHALVWTPDLSDNGLAVANELADAINEIHKETN